MALTNIHAYEYNIHTFKYNTRTRAPSLVAYVSFLYFFTGLPRELGGIFLNFLYFLPW